MSISAILPIIEKALGAFGHVDILVNNAGIIQRADALDFTETDWDEVMNSNFKTGFFSGQAVARQLVKQGSGGKIINIASMLSFQGGLLFLASAACDYVNGYTVAVDGGWLAR